jgi:hypothetical protein
LERRVRDRGEGSNPSNQCGIWKFIWKLNVSNPTKVFLWRACSDILPTRVNLRKRGVLDDDQCMLCGREPETVIHALWECPASQDVWGLCDIRTQKMSSTCRDVILLMERLVERCCSDGMEIYVVVVRSIWNRRNTVVHGGAFLHPCTLVDGAMESLQQFLKAQVSGVEADNSAAQATVIK